MFNYQSEVLTLPRKVSSHSKDVVVDGINTQSVHLSGSFKRLTGDLEVGHQLMVLGKKLREGINDVEMPSIFLVDFLEEEVSICILQKL